MKNYQDTETGRIYAFEDDINPYTLNNKNLPKTLSDNVIFKPDDSYVWYQGTWIKKQDAPMGYQEPTSSIPSYNPAWMAYLFPYSAVYRNKNSGLNITLDEINKNSYDGNKLSEVVATIPLDSSSGISALISYDGAIAIPQCDKFPSKIDAIDKLNEILCSILLGGIHTEVLHPNALSIGSLQDKIRLFSYTPSFHTQLRLNLAGISERIVLLNPRILMVEDIQNAFSQGQKIINAIDNFSPFFLLNGYTALFHRNNIDALNNLWIVVEQLTNYLCRKNNIETSYISKKNGNEQDHPIWYNHKRLLEKKIIANECYAVLNTARVKRNDLAHRGIVSDFSSIEALWRVLPSLFEVCSGIHNIGINNIGCRGDGNWAIPKKTNFDDWYELSINLGNDR